MGHHVFGCDICQDVCPWNRNAPTTQMQEFQPRAFAGESGTESLFLPDLIKIAKLSPEQFRERFRGSPIKRTKWQGLVRNACIALGNARMARGSASYLEAMDVMSGLSQSDDAVISESARWALSRIQANGD